MKQILKYYNLFYIFMSIIWPPFRLYILKVDGAGMTIMIMSILVILLNLLEFWKKKELFTTPAMICWITLLCYSLWNVFAKGFNTEYSTFKFLRVNFFDSFVLLLITMVELNRNKEKVLWVLWIALCTYLLIGLPSFGIRGDEGRYGTEGIGNLYPLHTVTFLFVSSLLFAEDKIKLSIFILIVVGISIIILLSGTRKAFGAEAIILLGVVLNNSKKKTFWSWVRIVVLGGVLLYGTFYVMNNTLIGERIFASVDDDDFYVQLVENNKINDFLMLMLGDRAVMYEMGIELFHENFWTGIGLTNYKDMSGGELRLHSEYMVQLCENGLVGFILLMLFYVLLMTALIFNRKDDDNRKTKMAFWGLFTLLFLNLTSWTYCQNFAMVFYAILLTYAYPDLKINNVVEKNENRHPSQREQFQQSLDRIFGTKPNSL